MSPVLRILLAFLAFVAVAGLFVVLRPDSSPAPVRSTTPSTSKPAPKLAPRLKVQRVRIANGKPVGGVRTIAYRKGERVKIAFSSASPVEVHLHGYDLEASGSSSRPAVLSFKASLEGRFEIEEHGSGAPLARLEVRP